VFKKMKFEMSKDEIEATVNCVTGVVEYVLMRLQARISEIKSMRASGMTHGSVESSSFGGSGAAPSARETPVRGGPVLGSATHAASAVSGSRSETALLVEKEQRIQALEETVEYLELKTHKLEQLVRLKDNRIATLQAKLQSLREGLA
jgi:hypothetical protein